MDTLSRRFLQILTPGARSARGLCTNLSGTCFGLGPAVVANYLDALTAVGYLCRTRTRYGITAAGLAHLTGDPLQLPGPAPCAPRTRDYVAVPYLHKPLTPTRPGALDFLACKSLPLKGYRHAN